MSKQFTAACVLLLVLDGKLDLDSSVAKYLPGAPPAWRPITLHHLLTHTSGIPNLTSLTDFQQTKTLHSSLAQTLQRFRDLPLEFPPGTDGRYSNSGYIVLASVVEHMANQDFALFLNSRVLKPLGLSDTGTDTFRTILRHRVSGYTRFSEGLGNTDYIDMSIPLGAGSLYSTTSDLYRWTIALQRDGFIRSDLLKRMLTPTRHNYGYGLEIRTEHGERIIGHGGGIEGFNSFLQYREKDALVVVVLANINTGVTGKLANDLASAARES